MFVHFAQNLRAFNSLALTLAGAEELEGEVNEFLSKVEDSLGFIPILARQSDVVPLVLEDCVPLRPREA